MFDQVGSVTTQLVNYKAYVTLLIIVLVISTIGWYSKLGVWQSSNSKPTGEEENELFNIRYSFH